MLSRRIRITRLLTISQQALHKGGGLSAQVGVCPGGVYPRNGVCLWSRGWGGGGVGVCPSMQWGRHLPSWTDLWKHNLRKLHLRTVKNPNLIPPPWTRTNGQPEFKFHSRKRRNQFPRIQLGIEAAVGWEKRFPPPCSAGEERNGNWKMDVFTPDSYVSEYLNIRSQKTLRWHWETLHNLHHQLLAQRLLDLFISVFPGWWSRPLKWCKNGFEA